MMPRKLHVCTDEIGGRIAEFIAAGAFPHVASEACGVPVDVFDTWMSRGARRKDRNGVHKRFRRAIQEAIARARVAAEIKVFRDDPKSWLCRGPGREMKDVPGWSQPAKAIIARDKFEAGVLASPEWNGLWRLILEVLERFPEARGALISNIERMGSEIVVPSGKIGGAAQPLQGFATESGSVSGTGASGGTP